MSTEYVIHQKNYESVISETFENVKSFWSISNESPFFIIVSK